MLYIPPALLRKVGAKVWRDHVEAWDGIFNQGRTTIKWPYLCVFVLGGYPLKNLLTMCIIWGVSGSLHPKHLQALASRDWPFKEVSWCLGQPAPAGQTVHRRHQSQHYWADGWGSRHGQRKNQKKNKRLWPEVVNRFVCLSDLDHPAVDLIWTRQTSKPPGGAEGGGGCSARWKPRRHAGDAEAHSTGQRSSEGNTEVKKN